MNKYLFFVSLILLLISCSKDNEGKEQDSLTSVNISVETTMDSQSTRAIWGDITTGNSVSVVFEKDEYLDLYELYGESVFDKHVFTNSDAQNYQSGNFSGSWHKDGTRWAAVLPSGSSTTVSMNGDQNIYTLSLPYTQETRKNTVKSMVGNIETQNVSPDKTANLMIGAQNGHSSRTCFLSPICAYLYFVTETSISSVEVSASEIKTKAGQTTYNGCMAGKVTVTTEGQWNGWSEFVDCIKRIQPSQTSGETVNHINVTGQNITRSNNTTYREYIVCLYPGYYKGLTIKYNDPTKGIVTLATSTATLKFESVNLYYLGQVDASAKSRTLKVENSEDLNRW